MWIGPIVLLIFFELVADIFAEKWSLSHSHVFWAVSLSCYVIGNIFWLYAMKDGSGLARGAVIFSVVSAIFAVFVGLVVYREHVTRIELAGMIVGLIGMMLIFWNDFKG